jgi:hypothetical protein
MYNYQHNLWQDLRDIRKIPFTALRKLGFIMDECDWELYLNIWWNIPGLISTRLWDAWKSSFMAPCKLGSVMYQYGSKSELRCSFRVKVISVNKKICSRVHALIKGKAIPVTGRGGP